MIANRISKIGMLLTIMVFILIMIQSCKFTDKQTADNTKTADWQIILIEKSENPVELKVSGSAAFEGMTDIINGAAVKDGNICAVNTFAEVGNYFGGSYDVEGENTRNARYILTPMGQQRQNPVQLGVNYFSVSLETAFWQAERVEIQFDRDVTIRGLNGNFEILVSVWREDDWLVETPLTRFTGVLEETGDVTLSFIKDEYRVSSTSEINQFMVEGYDGWRNVLTEAAAATPLKAYTVQAVNGQYAVNTGADADYSSNNNTDGCNCPCNR